MKTITRSRTIAAPKEAVWTVLLEDEYNRAWYAEFALGTYADTDWIIGHTVRFRNESGGGMIAGSGMGQDKSSANVETR